VLGLDEESVPEVERKTGVCSAEDGDEVVLQNTVHLQFLDARLSSNNIPDTQKKKFLLVPATVIPVVLFLRI
jgi:hypothetical protein